MEISRNIIGYESWVKKLPDIEMCHKKFPDDKGGGGPEIPWMEIPRNVIRYGFIVIKNKKIMRQGRDAPGAF